MTKTVSSLPLRVFRAVSLGGKDQRIVSTVKLWVGVLRTVLPVVDGPSSKQAPHRVAPPARCECLSHLLERQQQKRIRCNRHESLKKRLDVSLSSFVIQHVAISTRERWQLDGTFFLAAERREQPQREGCRVPDRATVTPELADFRCFGPGPREVAKARLERFLADVHDWHLDGTSLPQL